MQLIHLNSPLAAEHSSPCFLQVVNLLFVVHVDPVFGAIPIFLGPIYPTSPSSDPLRNTRVHCDKRQQRLLEGDYASVH